MLTNTSRRLGAYLARAGTAAGVIGILNWIFNYPFLALVVLLFDFQFGSLIWIIAGVALNYACVIWYKRTTQDWFGLEYLRLQEKVESTGYIASVVRWALRRSRWLAFMLISLLVDPIYGFIYQRGRVSGKNLNLPDWLWFIAANFLGMLPWLLGAYGGYELIKMGIEAIKRAIV